MLEERDLHGYALVCEFKRRGWGTPSPGSIYPLLAQLQRGGYVHSHVDNGRRLYSLASPPAHKISDAENDVAACGGLHSAALRLLHAIAQVEEHSAEVSVRVRAILDTARREIYELLARE